MPAANLPHLNTDPSLKVGVQRTTLALDVLGRFVCNTLDEALNPDREAQPPFDLSADFDAVVIGSGMYGAYCAARLYRNGAKVLVLEAGPFLISEHYQNLSNIGLGTGGGVDGRPGPGNPDADEVTDQVWGLPWRGNQFFARQAFCVGGKSLFWGGWAPRLTDDVLAGAVGAGKAWPKPAADYLKTYYEAVELQTGVRELVTEAPGQAPVSVVSTDLFNDPLKNRLTAALKPKLEALVGAISVRSGSDSVDTEITAIEPAPIAVQADAPASGLFSFDKFSSLPLLVEAVRDDIGRSGDLDQRRRLFVVPNVRVQRLIPSSDGTAHRVVRMQVWDGEASRTIDLPGNTRVILALSAIESTRLALDSFTGISPLDRLIGRNLMAHLRSNVTMRIRREALAIDGTNILQTSAFHVAGRASTGGRYHLQFYAGFQPGPNAEAVLYRMIPDTDMVEAQLANQDPNWVAITFRGIGEMLGRTDLDPGDPAASYINLSQEFDGFGQRRAWVHYVQQDDDLRLFDEMDQAAFEIALRLAGSDPDDIEYWDEQMGQWTSENPYAHGLPRFGKLKQEGGIRDALGTTYHDCGTLWMGDDPQDSVTDPTGRFHQVPNAYCVDQAVFPRGGSANPVPTGLVLARRSAEAVVNGVLDVVETRDDHGRVTALNHRAEAGFTPLFVFDRLDRFNRDALLPRGWEHRGAGAFSRFGLVMETVGGTGILCYTAEEFADFTLRLQWRAPTIRNNSGVYVRLPREFLLDATRLAKTGYEIQIDNTGERPADAGIPFTGNEIFNPFHQTGAIYPVHPQDGFPQLSALPDPNGCPSVQPIPTRSLESWNDMEILADGNRVRVILNGVPVLQGGDYVDRRNVYGSGLIGLQNHFKGSRVQFRHMRIKVGTP